MARYSNDHCLSLFVLILVTSSLLSTNAREIERSNVNSVKLSALGRSARLGSLYDARTEELTGVSIFKNQIPPHLITKIQVPATTTRYGIIKSYSDKSALLDVSASLTLSFLYGLISVTGAARFLSDEKKTSNSVVGSLSYETTTTEEILELFYDEVLEYLNPAVIENATETHIVVGQGFGSNTLIKFEDSNSRNEAVSVIEARMGASLEILGFGISVDAEMGVGDTTIETFSSYTTEIFGDVSLGTEDYPTNVTQVVKLIGRIPDLIKNSGVGKGKQLYFYLLPLEHLRRFLNSSAVEEEVKDQRSTHQGNGDGDFDLPESETSSQLQVFEEMALIKQKMNDLYRSLMTNRDILNNTDLYAVQSLKNRFNNLTIDFRANSKRAILDFRSGFKLGKDFDRNKKINNLRIITKDADSSLEQFENIIDNDFKETRLKIDLVDYLRSSSGSQVMWVGRSDSVESSAVKLFKETGAVNATICSIHFHRIYLKNTILFVNAVLEATNKNLTVAVVDCDFPKESCQLDSSLIKTCTVIFEPPTQKKQNDVMSSDLKTIKSHRNENIFGSVNILKSEKSVLNQFVKLISPLKNDKKV